MACLRSVLLCCLLAAASAFAPPSCTLPPSRAAVQRHAISMTAATKATRVNQRNRAYNKKYKSEMRTRVKSVRVPHPRDCPDRLPHVPVQRRSSQRCRLSAGRWWLAAVPD